jgi:hypothetical protein
MSVITDDPFLINYIEEYYKCNPSLYCLEYSSFKSSEEQITEKIIKKLNEIVPEMVEQYGCKVLYNTLAKKIKNRISREFIVKYPDKVVEKIFQKILLECYYKNIKKRNRFEEQEEYLDLDNKKLKITEVKEEKKDKEVKEEVKIHTSAKRCIHGRTKNICKECMGSSICKEHKKFAYACKDCALKRLGNGYKSIYCPCLINRKKCNIHKEI